jgi:hypothetical protein
VDSLDFQKYNISKLYIKLDKKLQIDIEEIVVKKHSGPKVSEDDIENFFSYLVYFYAFVDQLHISNIKFEDQKSYKLLYKYGEFYLSEDDVELFASLEKRGKVTTLKIKKLIYNKLGTAISGELVAYNNFSYASFEGYIDIAQTRWKTNLYYKDSILRYDLKSNIARSIEPIMKVIESQVEFDKEISDWIYKKIKASSYEIKYLKGVLNTKTFEFDPDQIYAKAVVKNADVYFHNNLQPAKIKQIDLEIINNSLRFRLTDPSYQGLDAKGTYVQINNLFTKGAYILVDIKTKNIKLDSKIRNILQAFDVDFDLEQKSGFTDADLLLNIRFIPYEVNTKGKYIVKKGSFVYLDGIDFNASNVEISHNNNIVNIKKGNIRFKNLIDTDIADGVLDLNTKKFTSGLGIKSVVLKEKSNDILEIKNELMNIEVDYSIKNDLKISIPKIPLNITVKDDTFYFDINDLSLSSKYFPLQKKYFIKEGDVSVETSDFINYFATLNASNIETPLMKNSKEISSLHLDVAIDKENIIGVDRFEGVEFVFSDNLHLYLHDFDINLSKTSTMMKSLTSRTLITAHNSKALLDENSEVIFDKAEVAIDENSTKIDLEYDEGALNFNKVDKKLTFDVQNMNQDFVKKFLNFDEFDGGKYNAKGYLDSNDTLHIDFEFEDAYVKDSTVLNNFISFINTIPSLATFNDNYFDKSGYLIKNGSIKAQIKNKILILDEIDLKGVNADFKGSGYANLSNKSINLSMKMSTFKHIGNIVSAIPLAGYIILGDDGTIGASFDVKGTFDNPQIITNIAKDGILAPMNIFKRVITLPLKIFEKE